MRDRVFAAADAAGRDPTEITCAYNMGIRVDAAPETDPNVVSGPPDAIAERLLGFLKLGFTAMNFQPIGPGEEEQIERLARDVIPTLRSAV